MVNDENWVEFFRLTIFNEVGIYWRRLAMNVEEQRKAMLSNFRQYATVYNELTEVCFTSCVQDLGQRRLSEEEASCADTCAAKLLQATSRMVWKMAELNPLQQGGGASALHPPQQTR